MDRVIVKRNPAEERRGKIVLALQDQPDSGRVVAVGPGKRDKYGNPMPVGVAVGEVVYFDKAAGQELEENGERYLVMTPEAIIGVAEIESPAAAAFQGAVARLVEGEPVKYKDIEAALDARRGDAPAAIPLQTAADVIRAYGGVPMVDGDRQNTAGMTE